MFARHPPRIVGKHSWNCRLRQYSCKNASRRPCSRCIEIERVEFLGTNVAHQERRAVRREAAPGNPRCYDAPEAHETGHMLQFSVCDAHSGDGWFRAVTTVEVHILAVSRPLWKPDTCLCQLRPLLCPPLHFQSTTLDFSSHASQGGQGFVATLLKRASLKISSRCHAAQTSGHYGNESRNCSRPYACTASLRLRGFP